MSGPTLIIDEAAFTTAMAFFQLTNRPLILES